MCLIFQVKPFGLIFSALKYLWRKQMVMLFLENISLRRFHTFATEAKARYYLEFSSADELREMWKARPGLFSQVLVMGGGSNLLFTGDYPGMVIRPAVTGIALEKEDDRHVWLRAGAGVVWDDFVSFAVDAGWGGVENLSLIPGMVGAVPVQNIGAYGCEAASVISSVTGVEFPSGEIRDYDASSCRFAYRSSLFKEQLREKFIITSVVFRLDKAPRLKLEYGELKMEVMKKFKGSKASPFKGSGVVDVAGVGEADNTESNVQYPISHIQSEEVKDEGANDSRLGTPLKTKDLNLTTSNEVEVKAKAKAKMNGEASFKIKDLRLEISQVREAVIRIRRGKLPDPALLGNAGSFFKNPVVRKEAAEKLKAAFPGMPVYPAGGSQSPAGETAAHGSGEERMKLSAGWLIDQCGWKGFRRGDAGVHRDHALVLVNYGDASGMEIFKLSEEIRFSVRKRFGVELEREVIVVG